MRQCIMSLVSAPLSPVFVGGIRSRVFRILGEPFKILKESKFHKRAQSQQNGKIFFQKKARKTRNDLNYIFHGYFTRLRYNYLLIYNNLILFLSD